MLLCPYCSGTVEHNVRLSDRAILVGCSHCMNPFVVAPEGGKPKPSVLKGGLDVRQMAQPGSVGAAVFEALPAAMEALPVLPEIAQRVMQMTHDPDVGMKDLAKVIREDQVITLKLLKLANSAVYGGLTEIKDLDAACARLGMANVAGTVVAIANSNMYRAKSPRHKTMMQGLWRHALASAHCAGQLATAMAEPGVDTLFVAGLIHDVGKVLLLHLAADETHAAIAPLRASDELFDEVMRVFHAILGFYMTQQWNLPAEFGITTFCHENLETIPDEDWVTAVHIVALASALATQSGCGLEAPTDTLLNHPSCQFLGLNDIKLAGLRVDLEDKLQALLEVTGGPE